MRIRAVVFAALLVASAAAAQERPAAFRGELGVRYWYSTGIHKHSHSAQGQFPNLGNPTSVLTYENLDAHAGEVYGRQNFGGSWFLKGNVGGGRIITGSFDDEDYHAGQQKFSDTTSSVPEGWLWYFSLDVGRYQSLRTKYGSRLSGFIGYAQWTEYVDAYGATYTVDTEGPGAPIPRGVRVISNKATWRAVRLGLAADLGLSSRTKLAIEAAFIPYGTVRNEDSHYLRADPGDLGQTPNIVITGYGRGMQFETVLRHEIAPRLDFSIGWRYWYMKATHGERTLPNFPEFDPLPLVELYSKRFGVTVALTRRW
jgi:hypothetical protein